jgi:hypothetical protein
VRPYAARRHAVPQRAIPFKYGRRGPRTGPANEFATALPRMASGWPAAAKSPYGDWGSTKRRDSQQAGELFFERYCPDGDSPEFVSDA